MKTKSGLFLTCSALLLFTMIANAQPLQQVAVSGVPAFPTDSITKDGYTLVVINKAPDFDSKVKQRMIDAFFTVYPKEAAIYNKKTLKQVTFVIDPAYGGVAECGGGVITFSPAWLKQNPGDIDVVTHEAMHVVQDYPGDAGPGWITEGIADYVRHTLGVDNAGGNWSLPAYASDQHYENAYRVTARFFVWLEKKKHPGIVKKLDTAMRSKTYTEAIWKKLTGKTVDELWQEYGQNPDLK
jgi:hypothetical protein